MGLNKMETYIKRDKLGNNIYEKTEGSGLLNWDKEVFREYDKYNRLVKTTVKTPNGETNIYTNEYRESVDEKGGVCKYHINYKNGQPQHETKEVIDYNGIKRFYTSYMYNEELNKWYISRTGGYNEKGLKTYEKVSDEYNTFHEEKLEYDDKGRCILNIDILEGTWERKEYDENGNITKLTKDDGFEEIREYDEHNKIIYRNNTKGFEEKRFIIEIDGIKYEREQWGYPNQEKPNITITDTPLIEREDD